MTRVWRSVIVVVVTLCAPQQPVTSLSTGRARFRFSLFTEVEEPDPDAPGS